MNVPLVWPIASRGDVATFIVGRRPLTDIEMAALHDTLGTAQLILGSNELITS
jgi:hypothetical protein